MGMKIDDIVARFPQERQAKVRAGARVKIDETIREAEILADVRDAVGETRVSVAAALGIGQRAVSQLEKRSEIYLSTLRRMLRALDLELTISIENAAGTRVQLPDLFSIDAPAEAASAPVARKASSRKPRGAAIAPSKQATPKRSVRAQKT